MAARTVGILHPGSMGAAVGRVLVEGGHAVAWASAGRSGASARRAAAAGLHDAGGIAPLLASSEVVLSICPPHAALDVARQVAAAGFAGLFVDANAISPATARAVADIVGARARVVDGGIIGPPPAPGGRTRLYLSGPGAQQVAGLFGDGPLQARVLPGGVGGASALKMAYAAWTKGGAALLLAAHSLAEAEGVAEGLDAEWAASGVADRYEGARDSAAAKGWRWVGEMEEIAAAMRAHALPEGFHRAAAEVFRGWPRPAEPGGGG